MKDNETSDFYQLTACPGCSSSDSEAVFTAGSGEVSTWVNLSFQVKRLQDLSGVVNATELVLTQDQDAAH